jgi:NlpC/P60 family putative phage cell wall peptidase
VTAPLRPVRRAEIVACARRWLGTPYLHQASVRGVGCDCIGLVGGVWGDLYGHWPEKPPPYRSDWAELGSDEPLLGAARRHFHQLTPTTLLAGDLVLFRMSPQAQIKHCAIVSAAKSAAGEAKIIHAYWGRSAVESWMGPWWRRRLAARFSFPTVAD